MNEWSSGKLCETKFWDSYLKVGFENDTGISVKTTNPHQQIPCATNGIIFVSTISYCTIQYLLIQEFLTIRIYQ